MELLAFASRLFAPTVIGRTVCPVPFFLAGERSGRTPCNTYCCPLTAAVPGTLYSYARYLVYQLLIWYFLYLACHKNVSHLMVSPVVSRQRDIQLQLVLLVLLLKHSSTNAVFCASFGRADRPDLLLRNGLPSRTHCPARVAIHGRVVLAV